MIHSVNYVMLQDAAEVLCAALGFTGGFLRRAESETEGLTLPPPWIGSAVCLGDEEAISDCSGVSFGDTTACGVPMALYCSSNAASAPPPPSSLEIGHLGVVACARQNIKSHKPS